MNVGDKKAKFKVPVGCKSYASKHAAYVYCNSINELNELIEDNYNEIHDSGYFSTNVSNDFEIDDVDIAEHGLKEIELSMYFENIEA